jgi:U3 small nucleolar ribonucleoprotein protein LCP5
MDAASEGEEDEVDRDAEDAQGDGIYRPPKLAPMPYNESGGRKDKRERRRPVPAALANLAYLDPSRPHLEGTSGLGAAPASSLEAASSRAREIRRMTEFEEENFTRLVLKKKDERQRRRDEEDIALGGVPTIARAGRRRGGLEDEFGDVLRSVGRSARAATGDGYEELRQRGRKDGVLARSRKRPEVEEEQDEGPKMRKRSRFDREAKAVKKRTSLKRK